MDAEFSLLEQRLKYEFKDKGYLRTALTHPSFAIEKQLNYNNQRLEYLGDSVLDLILSEYLFKLYADADEGDLTKIRSALVCQSALATLVKEWEISDYVLLGKGEKMNKGELRESLLADIFEAVTGAIYLDGGMKATRKIALDLYAKYFPYPKEVLFGLNPKGELQEYSQAKWGAAPEYAVFKVSGPEHDPEYMVEVRIKPFCAMGRGNSRKSAESDAARRLLDFISRKTIK